jgi:hypothetical protein
MKLFSYFAFAASAGLLTSCVSSPELLRTELNATLTGHQQTPAAGDLDGTGTARVIVEAGQERICWDLAVRGIEPATAAHIHRGAAGSAGPPLVTLTTPGADGRSNGCTAIVRDLGAEIAAAPDRFYVNVHNAPYPGGAVRGQLRGRSFIQPGRPRENR